VDDELDQERRDGEKQREGERNVLSLDEGVKRCAQGGDVFKRSDPTDRGSVI
jgi:hypothetical protein